MPFVDTYVVFLLVCLLLQTSSNLGSTYHVAPALSICAWGNPHLEPFVQWHVYVHTGKKKPFVDKYAVFLLVCLLFQTSSNLGSTYHITFSYPIFAWGNPHLEPFMQ